MHFLEDGVKNPLSALDALTQIEQETSAVLDPLSIVEASIETIEALPAPVITTALVIEEVPSIDPLGTIEAPTASILEIKKTPKFNISIFDSFKFLLHYIAVSVAVFAILLVSTNWSAYYTIAMNAINPGALKASGMEIADSLNKSRITVFANADSENIEAAGKKETAETIKKQLEADNVQIKEDPFSMKHLIPSEPNIQVGFDITPYENRIIIPKIGKNIPLVDIMSTNTFDFDHMENIFMQELEKGVVRYPGSALPGEQGNSFIFGHSSNYPWLKGSYNDIFALLDDLEFGDQIIVYYNQKKFVYVVKEKKVVKPGDVKVLDRDPAQKELSLMTCWPVGTTLKRMLVFTELQETSHK